MASFQLQKADVLARLKPFGISFEKSLTDLIKGMRSRSKESPESVEAFLELAVIDCRNELQSHDLESKAMAVLKLAYLEMYGFDMAWSSFHILEVMSSPKLQHKRIGYLLAIQTFSSESELFILATNQFKKDLGSHNHIEVGLALSGIAATVTPSLAKDINDDVLNKLTHSKPYIRKKAMLCMYKIFLQYPDSLRDNFDRIIQRLDDSETAVVSATVNVICEISKLNPKIFINYLPRFFVILEEAQNNWLVIRILKLFTSLSKVEPRIKKKVLPIILKLMEKTQASSLVYECINCIVRSNMLSSDSHKDKDCARLCITKLLEFFATHDPNLKYVGLIAMINILEVFPSFIHNIEGITNVVMDCLGDPDLNIRVKALEICHHLVSEDNIVDVIKLLLVQLLPKHGMTLSSALQANIITKIIEICLLDNYALVPNFSWYVAVLKDIVQLALIGFGGAALLSSRSEVIEKLAQEFTSLATKVPSVRYDLLNSVVSNSVRDVKTMEKCPELLRTFYWIMGEYAADIGAEEYLDYEALPQKTAIFEALVNFDVDEKSGTSANPRYPVAKRLPQFNDPDALLVLLQALVKLYLNIALNYCLRQDSQGQLCAKDYWELAFMLHKLIRLFNTWLGSMHYEVQERAVSWLEFLRLALEAMTQEESLVLEEMESAAFTRPKLESQVNPDSESQVESGSESGLDSESSSRDLVELGDIQPEYETATQAIEGPSFANQHYQIPALISQVLPSLFNAYQLNPIARNTQRKIAIPQDLDLETIPVCLESEPNELTDSAYNLYISDPQDPIHDDTVLESSKDKQKQRDNYVNDPFYIQESATCTKNSKAAQEVNPSVPEYGAESDLTKPVLEIIVDEDRTKSKPKKPKKMKREKVLILNEETIDSRDIEENAAPTSQLPSKPKRNALNIDSSLLENFSLDTPAKSLSDGENPAEYTVDLAQMREKLSRPKKSKKAKIKAHKSTDSADPENSKTKIKKPKKKKAVILD